MSLRQESSRIDGGIPIPARVLAGRWRMAEKRARFRTGKIEEEAFVVRLNVTGPWAEAERNAWHRWVCDLLGWQLPNAGSSFLGLGAGEMDETGGTAAALPPQQVVMRALAFASRRRARDLRLLLDTPARTPGGAVAFELRLDGEPKRYEMVEIDLAKLLGALAAEASSGEIAHEEVLAPAALLARAIEAATLPPAAKADPAHSLGLILVSMALPRLPSAALRAAIICGTMAASETYPEVWLSLDEADYCIWSDRQRVLPVTCFDAWHES